MLRMACDLDGTLADLSSAYRRVEDRVQRDSESAAIDLIHESMSVAPDAGQGSRWLRRLGFS